MIVDFNILNDALIHWLRNSSGVWREPSKSHVGKFDKGVACCVIQEQQNMLVLHFHSAIESR